MAIGIEHNLINNDVNVQKHSQASLLPIATQDIVTQNYEDKVTISGNDNSDSSHENDVFSHQRSQAMSAYLKLNKQDNSQNSNKDTSDKTKNINNQENYSDDKNSIKDKEDKKTVNGKELTKEEQEEVEELKDREEEVKTHENAHKTAGGQYAAAPSYKYKTGPDGKRYINDGSVNIDVSEEKTPQKTIEKMKTVIKAANAPAEPSSEDKQVAAQAQQTLNKAQKELQKEQNKSN